MDEYICAAALKNDAGNIVEVTVFRAGKSQILRYYYDVQKGMPEYYFWKSLESMRPLTEKKTA